MSEIKWRQRTFACTECDFKARMWCSSDHPAKVEHAVSHVVRFEPTATAFYLYPGGATYDFSVALGPETDRFGKPLTSAAYGNKE